MMKKAQLLGSLILVLVAMIWGTAFAAQRVGMDYIKPVTFTAARMTLAAVAVGIVALLQKDPDADSGERRKFRRTNITGGIFCGLFLFSGSIFQQIGIVNTTAGKAGFISALYILLVPVISFILFRKRYPWLVWLAVLIGIAGMYLMCMTERFTLAHSDVLIIICAFMFTGHILCCDYFVKRGNAIRISAVQMTVTAVISWLFAFIMETPSIDQIRSALIPILYCGLVSGGVGFTLQLVAQKYSDPTVASLLMSLESVFAAIAGAVLLHERMSARELIGCIIMFSAIIIVQIPVNEKSGVRLAGKDCK